MTSTLESPPSAAPATAWDTEVFVLRADSRDELHAKVLALADRVAGRPLAKLAAELASELRPGGARLAVVAGSHADLLTRLKRAAERLADPKCKQIRDANGLYFFAEPLAEQGAVALLFPGEGAQYLNMLADLCGVFPEVEETFAWCDQLATEAGRPEASLRRVLHLPPDATADDKVAAENELRGLGPSIFGVLIADQAIFRILQKLRIPASAVAGHSAGELGALLVAGAMGADSSGARLIGIMDLMQRQEAEAGGPDVALLAVGASKQTISEVAATVAGGAVVVAMDNCPHQCVAVGPTHLVAAVEAALTEKGVLAERLPFKRPYHTPLFEPYMGAFRELFANVPFTPPHTPVYCCTTAGLFPADTDAVRELAVNQWVTPVEFTRTIEAMHADGVRVFVECGPRGNLSAFVEDILRGKSFAAIPANVPRKSGPTQINHMVAQLVAHGVELELGALYEGRVGEEPTPQPPPGREGSQDLDASIVESTREGSGSPSLQGGGWGIGSAVHAYLDVMEQFLDTQRAVMSAFLSGAPSVAALGDPGAIPFVEAPRAQTPVTDDVATEEQPFALVETVVEHAPGRAVTYRRVMDLREDRYADDHTLGGREVSRVDPAQNGLPVLPMTFSLEAMSEAASLLAPGKVVVAIRDIRLFRWLPFDPEPTTLEVRASVAAVDPESGVVEVRADVRDLGNSFLRDAAGKSACEAVVVLADRYPEPPEPLPFDLTDEVPCTATVDALRKNMFHGPIFQMIRSLDRVGVEGIEGTLEVQSRETWFRSNPDPRYAIDPVLTDAAMHILGAWHLEQPDWSGRILLPIGVHKVEFFGPPPPVGAHVLLRGHNDEETARQVRHGLEVFDTSGNVFLRLTGAGYWRFYLPFGHVNFFGPKDEYFLSRVLPEAVAGDGRCHYLEPPADLKQPVLRAAGARVTMTSNELAEFGAWTGTDVELNDWFFGRMLAKDAVRAAWNAKYGEAMYPADIETAELGGTIVCSPRGAPKGEPFPPVSVVTAGGKVVAFSAFAERVGIALEALAKNATTEAETAARRKVAVGAVANALRVAPDACTCEALNESGAAVVATGGKRFRAQTARHKDAVVATTTCEVA